MDTTRHTQCMKRSEAILSPEPKGEPRSPEPKGGRHGRRRRLRTRAAAHGLPIVAAIASLGFEHAEAGILRDPPITDGLARASYAELGLRSTALEPVRAATASMPETNLSAACHRSPTPCSAAPRRGDKKMTPMASRDALQRRRRDVRWREFTRAESPRSRSAPRASRLYHAAG